MIGYKRREGLTFYHSAQRSQKGKMHHRDEDDVTEEEEEEEEEET